VRQAVNSAGVEVATGAQCERPERPSSSPWTGDALPLSYIRDGGNSITVEDLIFAQPPVAEHYNLVMNAASVAASLIA